MINACTEFPLISPQGANLIFRVKAWGLIGGGGAIKKGEGLKEGGGLLFFALGQISIQCTPRRNDVTRF